MTELGIMAYPDLSPMSRIKEYMALASKYGFTRISSSMLSVEGDQEQIIAYFKDFIEAAHFYHLKVSLDVNTNFLKKMHQNYDDISLFHQLHCDIIRLDGSYGSEHDLILINNPYGIQVEMNASSSRTLKEIEYFYEHGVSSERLLLCHNAYPVRYTGLKWQDFLDKNKAFQPYGYRIAAFVSSNAEHTHCVWNGDDGFVTVEKMRNYPIDLQMRLLLATDGVQDVMIGNAYATEAELKAMAEMVKEPKDFKSSAIYDVIKNYGPVMQQFGPCHRLKVILDENITQTEKENLLDLIPQTDNGDSSEWIWRSRCGRLINQNRFIPVRKYDGEYFPVGSILIMNDANRHYSGEIHIARLPILNDGKRNYLGKLAPHEEEMLELIKNGDTVEFYEYHQY